MLKRLLMSSLFVAVLAGCQPAHPAAAPTPTPPGAALGKEFTLQAGELVSIDGEGIAVRFDAVTNDSRCPSDVECVWAGQAVVVVSLAEGGIDLSEVSLTLMAGSSEPQQIGEYTIHLLALEPYPVSTKQIDADDYRVTLLIERS